MLLAALIFGCISASLAEEKVVSSPTQLARKGVCRLRFQHVPFWGGISSVTPTRSKDTTEKYLRLCKDYGIVPSADVLNRIEVGVYDFVMEPTGKGTCGDLDIRAFAQLLMLNDGMLLRDVRALDFSRCSLGPSSMLLVAELIRHPQSCIEVLDVSNQNVGPEGARAITVAVQTTGVLKTLRMPVAGIGDEGGEAVGGLLRRAEQQFDEIDIQNNYIGPSICTSIAHLADGKVTLLKLAGNRVFDEVWNAVTHCIGLIFAMVGSWIMLRKVYTRPAYYAYPCYAYCASMNILYLSSTLYHSFFALGRVTVFIFGVFDYSGIFMLIAGTYSPFLGVLFHEECWAISLLRGMWICAFLGITTAAFYRGPGDVPLRLTLFLLMGWSMVACVHRITNKIGRDGIMLVFLGGILYTAGVPFYVRDDHAFGFPDHAIWHIFVMLASFCHYCCIYFYVLDHASHDPTHELSEKLRDSGVVALDTGAETDKLVSGSSHSSDELTDKL